MNEPGPQPTVRNPWKVATLIIIGIATIAGVGGAAFLLGRGASSDSDPAPVSTAQRTTTTPKPSDNLNDGLLSASEYTDVQSVLDATPSSYPIPASSLSREAMQISGEVYCSIALTASSTAAAREAVFDYLSQRGGADEQFKQQYFEVARTIALYMCLDDWL